MPYVTSITAVAFSTATGEVVSKRFGYSPAEAASWILAFEEPRAVYESVVTGFHLVRALRDLGIDCIIEAVSKMHKLASDKRRKNDRNDAEFWLGSSRRGASWRCSFQTRRRRRQETYLGSLRTYALTSRARSTASPICS